MDRTNLSQQQRVPETPLPESGRVLLDALREFREVFTSGSTTLSDEEVRARAERVKNTMLHFCEELDLLSWSEACSQSHQTNLEDRRLAELGLCLYRAALSTERVVRLWLSGSTESIPVVHLAKALQFETASGELDSTGLRECIDWVELSIARVRQCIPPGEFESLEPFLNESLRDRPIPEYLIDAGRNLDNFIALKKCSDGRELLSCLFKALAEFEPSSRGLCPDRGGEWRAAAWSAEIGDLIGYGSPTTTSGPILNLFDTATHPIRLWAVSLQPHEVERIQEYHIPGLHHFVQLMNSYRLPSLSNIDSVARRALSDCISYALCSGDKALMNAAAECEGVFDAPVESSIIRAFEQLLQRGDAPELVGSLVEKLASSPLHADSEYPHLSRLAAALSQVRPRQLFLAPQNASEAEQENLSARAQSLEVDLVYFVYHAAMRDPALYENLAGMLRDFGPESYRALAYGAAWEAEEFESDFGIRGMTRERRMNLDYFMLTLRPIEPPHVFAREDSERDFRLGELEQQAAASSFVEYVRESCAAAPELLTLVLSPGAVKTVLEHPLLTPEVRDHLLQRGFQSRRTSLLIDWALVQDPLKGAEEERLLAALPPLRKDAFSVRDESDFQPLLDQFPSESPETREQLLSLLRAIDPDAYNISKLIASAPGRSVREVVEDICIDILHDYPGMNTRDFSVAVWSASKLNGEVVPPRVVSAISEWLSPHIYESTALTENLYRYLGAADGERLVAESLTRHIARSVDVRPDEGLLNVNGIPRIPAGAFAGALVLDSLIRHRREVGVALPPEASAVCARMLEAYLEPIFRGAPPERSRRVVALPPLLRAPTSLEEAEILAELMPHNLSDAPEEFFLEIRPWCQNRASLRVASETLFSCLAEDVPDSKRLMKEAGKEPHPRDWLVARVVNDVVSSIRADRGAASEEDSNLEAEDRSATQTHSRKKKEEALEFLGYLDLPANRVLSARLVNGFVRLLDEDDTEGGTSRRPPIYERFSDAPLLEKFEAYRAAYALSGHPPVADFVVYLWSRQGKGAPSGQIRLPELFRERDLDRSIRRERSAMLAKAISGEPALFRMDFGLVSSIVGHTAEFANTNHFLFAKGQAELVRRAHLPCASSPLMSFHGSAAAFELHSSSPGEVSESTRKTLNPTVGSVQRILETLSQFRDPEDRRWQLARPLLDDALRFLGRQGVKVYIPPIIGAHRTEFQAWSSLVKLADLAASLDSASPVRAEALHHVRALTLHRFLHNAPSAALFPLTSGGRYSPGSRAAACAELFEHITNAAHGLRRVADGIAESQTFAAAYDSAPIRVALQNPGRGTVPVKEGTAGGILLPTRGELLDYFGELTRTCLYEQSLISQKFPNIWAVYYLNRNEERQLECEGGTLVALTETARHERALVLFSINPSAQALERLGARGCFDALVEHLKPCLQEFGARYVLIPKDPCANIALTNSVPLFDHLKTSYFADAQACPLLSDSDTSVMGYVLSDRTIVVYDRFTGGPFVNSSRVQFSDLNEAPPT